VPDVDAVEDAHRERAAAVARGDGLKIADQFHVAPEIVGGMVTLCLWVTMQPLGVTWSRNGKA
jgi:hypothetical protein